MRVDSQGEASRSVPAQFPASPVPEVHSVFSNLVWPSSSGRQSRTATVAYTVLAGGLLDIPINLKGHRVLVR